VNEEGMKALLIAIMEHTPTLTNLNLSGNYLGKAGSAVLGELVGTSMRLETVLAADCRLDLDAFFEALGTSEVPESGGAFYMRRLDLSRNPSPNAGWLVPLAALVEGCGVRFESIALQGALGDGDAADDRQAEAGIVKLFRAMGLAASLKGESSTVSVDLRDNLAISLPNTVPRLLEENRCPSVVNLAGCMLNDTNLQKVLLALVNNTVTHTIHLGRNLDLDLEIYNFGEEREGGGLRDFFTDPFATATAHSPQALQRTQTAHMLAHVFEASTTLRHLDFTGKVEESLCFGVTMALALRSIAANKGLTRLDLTGNLIGDMGAEALGLSLRSNRSITALATDNNRIGVSGLGALRGALYGNRKIVEWPVMTQDIGAYLDLLAEGVREALLDEEAAHDLVKEASSFSGGDPVLKQEGVEALRAAKAMRRSLSKDTAKAPTPHTHHTRVPNTHLVVRLDGTWSTALPEPRLRTPTVRVAASSPL